MCRTCLTPFGKKVFCRFVILLFCCLAIFISRCFILNADKINFVKSYPNRDHYEQSLKVARTPNERWVESVRQTITDKGHPELLPLMEKLDRQYEETDEALHKIIRDKYLIEPIRKEMGAYWHLETEGETSMGQAQTVMKILNNKTKGFFVECGALDGESRSNTLTLERDFKWEGILIEADPENLLMAVEKRRRSWLVPACLSTQRNTMEVSFRAWGNIGSIVDEKALPEDNLEKQNMTRILDVVCLPFYAILKSIDQSQVDYLSLDVEGNELEILKTIPFDKINVKVISAEFLHASEKGNTKEDMKNFMESVGYVVHSEVTHDENLANDFIFVQRDLNLSEENKESKVSGSSDSAH